MLELEAAGFSAGFQRLWFPFVFFGFGVLGGLFPFHNWSPDGHVAAPTAVSMFHAGVLMKLGAFAALRVGIMLLPEGAKFHALDHLPGAGERRIRRIHRHGADRLQIRHRLLLGVPHGAGHARVRLALADGMLGAGLQMFSHGVMTALFFAVVGMVYDRAHTREIPKLGGIAKSMPMVAVAFIIGGLVSMGMPGLLGVRGRISDLPGLWQVCPIVAIVAAIGIVVTAAYIMLVVRRVFFGTVPEEFDRTVTGISPLDKVALAVFCACSGRLGVYPGLMAPLVQTGVQPTPRSGCSEEHENLCGDRTPDVTAGQDPPA